MKVFCGYDSFGKQLVQLTTFTPDPQRTEKQNQKALQNFAYEFEQRVISGKYLNGEKLTLAEFSARCFAEYAESQLEASSLAMYQRVMNQIVIPKLGHLKIAKITPLHITAFYNDLAKDGSRLDGRTG